MKNKITITRPTGKFGSTVTTTTINFPAMRLTITEAQEFLKQIEQAVREAQL